MTRIIKSYGFRFGIEGDGFVAYHAADDFDAACGLIKEALDAMPEFDVAALHVSDRLGDTLASERLDTLASKAKNEACRDWDYQEYVYISIAAQE